MKKCFTNVLSVLLAIIVALSASVYAFAETTTGFQIVADTVDAAPGSTINVDVSLKNNPGVALMIMSVSYDQSLLTLDKVTYNSAIGGTSTQPSSMNSPINLTWYNASANTTGDVVFATLTFTVDANAEQGESSDIVISSKSENITDINENTIAYTIVNGKVTVVNYKPGDINADQMVDGRDLLRLAKYYANWDVEVNPYTVDVNGDGSLDGRDLLRLAKYFAGWDVEIFANGSSSKNCAHSMNATEAKAETCEVDGNIAYWYCALCGKYFSDANGASEITVEDTIIRAPGHTVVTDSAVEPTYTSIGLTEGSHCSTCDKVLVEQTVIPMLQKTEYSITYKPAYNDEYLQQIDFSSQIAEETLKYTTEEGLYELPQLEVPGYNFVGWFDGTSSSATKITEIADGTKGNKTLYAHWELQQYTIQFDSPDVPVASVTYTVDKGITLVSPAWFGYTFVGWSENGNIVSSIKPGTTGNKTLHANWTSNRNQARAVTNLGEPMIIEDMENARFMFVYEIGTINNVPLEQIKYYGNTDGITINEEFEYSKSITSSTASTVANVVSNATTKTSAWTLSEDWNKSTSAINEHEEEIGKTQEKTDSAGNVIGSKYYVSNSSGGSSSTSSNAGGSSSTSSKVTTGSSTGINGSYTNSYESASSVGANVSATIGTETTAEAKIPGASASTSVNASISAGLDTEVSQKDTSTATTATSRAVNSGNENNNMSSSYWDTSSTSSSNWNTESGYEASRETSESTSVSKTISELINNKYSYSSSDTFGGENSTTNSTGTSLETSNEYSSTIEYSIEESETKKETITYKSDADGYYRLVTAGTVHVFAVVGYDIASNSYYTYTYNVLDKERHTYLDYSKDNANFNDCENAVLPFEVPYFVNDYIYGVIGKSSTLAVDYNTGFVTKYTGEGGNIVIPQYVSRENGDGTYSAVRVRGFNADVFSENDKITGVVLSKYISNIPDNAFKNCTNLKMVFAYGVSEIGNNAFENCISLERFNVDKYHTKLGANAFKNVPSISIEAANTDVADNAITCGAKRMTLNIASMTGEYNDKNIVVDNTTERFELIGSGIPIDNLSIKSNAKETIINNINFINNKDTPLNINSEKVTLNRVVVKDAPGFALILSSNNTEVSLFDNVNLSSLDSNAVLSKNISLKQVHTEVSSVMKLKGNLLVCGDTVDGQSLLSFEEGKIVYITEDDYERYLSSIKITFDANGGTISETSKIVHYGQTFGELPIPTMNYYTFDGWYTSMDGGTKINETTPVTSLVNQTLYAHWIPNKFIVNFDANGGIVSEPSKELTYGNALGTLPAPTRDYYTFIGWYTSATEGVQVTEATVPTSDDNITIYAQWVPNKYTITYDANGGTVSEIHKTVSCGEAVGDLPVPTRTGFTFAGWYFTDGTQLNSSTVRTTDDDITVTAKWSANNYKVSWNTGTGYSIVVKRTSSPNAGAAIGTLSNGSDIYYGDVLAITYVANTGYSITDNGSTNITVAGNVTSSNIYASANVNSYTYNVVYVSSNGTSLGSTTVTYNYGTINTIYAPAKSGYTTPSSQSVSWDSISTKTITFIYAPTAVSNSAKTGTAFSGPVTTYSARVEYQNRTANSVQIRISVTSTIQANGYNTYGQRFSATVGSVGTGAVTICSAGTWSNSFSSARSATGTSGWITVPINTTNATSVSVSMYYYQVNYNGTDMTANYGAGGISTSWTINIPAY